ncbi:MAG: hypothetical protein HFE83_02800 [Lachnospiraceae bacterium]|nr:hypothetical protein [Lachnospiraceae bacterium]
MRGKLFAGLAALCVCAVPMTALACGPCGARAAACSVSGCRIESVHEHCGYCGGVEHEACEFCDSTEHCTWMHDCTQAEYSHHRESGHSHGHGRHHS